MHKNIFIEALRNGGDIGEAKAKELYEENISLDFCRHLDCMLVSALKGDSPKSDLEYALHQVKKALEVIKQVLENQ